MQNRYRYHNSSDCSPDEFKPGGDKRGRTRMQISVGFSQVDSAQSKCGAVELDFRRANCPPGEIGAQECDYIMPAPLAGSSDLECLPYQGRDCIRDLSAGGTLLRPYPTCLARGARMLLMARWSSWDAVLVDLHAGDTGGPWRDVAVIRPRRDAAPGYPC